MAAGMALSRMSSPPDDADQTGMMPIWVGEALGTIGEAYAHMNIADDRASSWQRASEDLPPILVSVYGRYFGLIHVATSQATFAPIRHAPNGRHQLVLLAALVQGSHVANDLVMQGQYLKACVCLRQDIEYLAALRQDRAEDDRRDNKPPDMKYCPEFRRFLSELGHVAHAAPDTKIAGRLLIGPDVISTTPTYDRQHATWLYEHTVFLADHVLEELLISLAQMQPIEELAQAAREQEALRAELLSAKYMRPGEPAPRWRLLPAVL